MAEEKRISGTYIFFFLIKVLLLINYLSYIPKDLFINMIESNL